MAEDEVWYHGIGEGPGARAVVIEDAAGRMTGTLHHVIKHSPTGLSWGYAGSGPADCARSLLIAALGDKAKCPACLGTRNIAWLRDGSEDPVPFDYTPSDLINPESVGRCYDCDDGHRPDLPYQDFKFEFVAGWGNEWRMSRQAILGWLKGRGIE